MKTHAVPETHVLQTAVLYIFILRRRSADRTAFSALISHMPFGNPQTSLCLLKTKCEFSVEPAHI